MKQGSTLFLRAVVLFMGVVALAVGLLALPAIYKDAPVEYEGVTFTLKLFMAGLYGSIIPFFAALYQALKLLSYIDSNSAFSEKSVHALRAIKYCGIITGILYATAIPFLFQIAERDDAPGLGVIALAFACAPLVVATFAAVLEKLLQNAINIKSENDLTV